jgi:hypothetical protein
MSKCIGIVGSRRRNTQLDYLIVWANLRDNFKRGDTIVSGGCPVGGDKWAEILAEKGKIPIKIHRPDWDKHGVKATFVRNEIIAKDADLLIAQVADDRTGGTEDTIKKFKKLGKTNLILC